MNFKTWSRRRKALAIIGVLALVGASAALAIWTINGFGSGSAKAGELQELTVQSIDLSGAQGDLFPGQSGLLHMRVINPNSALNLTAVSIDGTLGSSNPTGCPASNLSAENVSGLSIPLIANGNTEITVPGVVSLAANAPDACQGVMFSVPVTVTAQP